MEVNKETELEKSKFTRGLFMSKKTLQFQNDEGNLNQKNEGTDNEEKNPNVVRIMGSNNQEKGEDELFNKQTNVSIKKKNSNNDILYYSSITEIQQVKKSLYKNSFFKSFYKKNLTEEEAKKVFFTSILKLNEVKQDSSPDNTLHLNFSLHLDKSRVNRLKATIKKYITNVNIMSVVMSLKQHIKNKLDFVEEFLSSSLKQIEIERENIRKLDLNSDYQTAKNSQERIRVELEIIKLEMEKRHGIQEEREMLKYKLWIELLRALYHKEIDYWIPLFKDSYRNYKPDELKKAVDLAYENFLVIKAKFLSQEEELNARAADFQAVKEHPIHAPNDLTTIYLEENQLFEEQLSLIYEKFTTLFDELFSFLMRFLKIYFLIFYLNRLCIDKQKAVQNDVARINLMDYEKEISEKSNFWYTQIEIKKSRLEQFHLHKINALIHEKNLALQRIQNARILKMESEIEELRRRVDDIEFTINQSNGFLGFLKNLQLNPMKTMITKGAQMFANQLAPGLGDIMSAFGANPPFVGEEPNEGALVLVNKNETFNFNNPNNNFQMQNKIMQKYNQDDDEEDTGGPNAPVSIGFVEKYISESKWGALNLFAGKHDILEEDPVSEMERENLKTGKIDFNAIYNFEKSQEKTFPKEMELKLQAVEMIKNLEKSVRYYSDHIEESIIREKEKLDQCIAIYEKYNGMLKQMYASDYASRLYKNRETMENFYYEKLMNEHSNFKKTNYSNILDQMQYYFSNDFISRTVLATNVIKDFAFQIANINKTGCCISLKNFCCGIYQMKFFQDKSVIIQELYSLLAKKTRKRLKIENKTCFKTIDRLKDSKLIDLINVACSKEFWSVSKNCVRETMWECYEKNDLNTKGFSGLFSKKLLLDYDLNLHANNVRTFIYEIIMLDAYKISV